MKHIYVVYARWDYEGESSIKAFASQKKAVELMAQCEAHHQKRTWAPGDATEEEYAAWLETSEKWEADHPAGSGRTSADSFGVDTVEFDDTEAP